jgi:hypothetical protein
MPTHADLAAKLLRDASVFFRSIAENNPDMKDQMLENAEVYDQVADLVQSAPGAEIDLDDPAEQ